MPSRMGAGLRYSYVSAAANFVKTGDPVDMVRAAVLEQHDTTREALFVGAAIAQESRMGDLQKAIADLAKQVAQLQAGKNDMGSGPTTDLTDLTDLE